MSDKAQHHHNPPDPLLITTMALKERVGTVVSNKMDKTVVVAVENRFPHPIYKKTVSRTSRYKAHDADNKCRLGDRVRITETRPLSASKRWRVSAVISNSAKTEEVAK